MSTGFNTPIELKLKRSPILIAAMIIVHSGAIACVFIVTLPLVIKVILALMLFAHAALILYRFAMPRSQYLPQALVLTKNECEIIWHNGEREMVEVEYGKSFYSRYLVILRLKLEKRKMRLPVLADMVDSDVFRNLRVHLKLKQ